MDFTEAQKILGPNLPTLVAEVKGNQELYIWLAIIYRQFILGWYQKIHSDGPLPRDVVVVSQQLINTIINKIENANLIAIIQDLIATLDLHIIDTTTAFERNPESPEQIYLGMYPHDGLTGRRKLDDYFFTVGLRLINGWLSNAPPLVVSLLATIFQQVFGAMVRSLSEPWMLHELLIKVLEPTNILVAPRQSGPVKQNVKRVKRKRVNVKAREETQKAARLPPEQMPTPPHTNVSKLDKARIVYATYLIPRSDAGNNESIFLFIQNHFISRSLFGNFVLSLAWPFHPYIARYTNSILMNAASHILTVDRYLWIALTLRNAIFPGGYMGPPRMPPPMAVQAQLRHQAMKLLNKRVQWIDPCIFDSNVINQRFLLSVLDYLFKVMA